MTILSARACLADAAPAESHPGLLWTRGLKSLPDQGSTDSNVNQQAIADRLTLFERARAALAYAKPRYQPAFQRYQQAIQASVLRKHTFTLTVAKHQRLLVGMGNPTPLEVGLTLHHSYGTPYIPGSALKGLAAHYAAAVWAEQGDGAHTWRGPDEYGKGQGEAHRFVFGSQNEAGAFQFLDAWMSPEHCKESTLADDVITPHHQGYNGADPDQKDKPIPPPADWDSPVPVQFLSVRDGVAFWGGITANVYTAEEQQAEIDQWLTVVRDLLGQALQDWGVGGKTSSGYGQMQLAVEASKK